MRKVLFAALLWVGASAQLAAAEPTLSQSQSSMDDSNETVVETGAKPKQHMYQCGLRAKPGDWPANAIWLAYGSLVEVASGSGAWIYVRHQKTFGWTLKQYFSPTPCA